MRNLLILVIICLSVIESAIGQTSYSTLVSASGSWGTAANWTTPPGRPPGEYNLNGNDNDVFYINGKINVGTTAANQDLTISKGLLSVEDTLIIYGNLAVGNNGDLTISNGGVLIVYGNVTIANQVTIAANSYFVIMGNLSKSGAQGSFTSDDYPSNVFIGGTISGNWSTTGPNDVLNCNLSQEHDNSNCNYGDPIDLKDSPIGDLVNDNCTDIPVISAISSNSPVLVGNTINLTTTTNPGTGSWPMEYYWEGPSGFTTTLEDPTRASATTAMTGYYLLTAFNLEGCSTTDSVYVEVTSNTCCSGYSYVSKDNFTGNWEDETSWATPNEPWRPLPPPTNPMNTQTLCINGRITVNGSLTINGGNQRICDTLIITGNLSVQSYSLNVAPSGVLIVLGNFTGASGSMDVDGRVVVVGEITSPSSNSVSNDGAFYVFDDTPSIVGFTPSGDESTLETNDPTLFDLIVNLTCGPTINGGTIAASQTRCEGIDVEAFTSIADASPGAFTYQWYYSTSSSDPAFGTWNTITGATATTYDAGPLTETTYYYRRAIKSAGCTKASNAITITVYPVPVTGPQFHIDNTWND